VDDARDLAEAGALVLDVREADEWHAGHIEGALWIPVGELTGRQDELPGDRSVVVICRSGARSHRVAAALLQAGYDAMNVAGGMKSWATAGYDIVTDDGAPGTVV
jgi:rhodanese-related sulfurtransferase